MITATLQLRRINHFEATFRSCRAWRSFDYHEFERDLQHSVLMYPSTADVAELVSTYNETVLSLIDIHAPLRRVRCSVRTSAAWYDGECRAAKRFTRLLEGTQVPTQQDARSTYDMEKTVRRATVSVLP